MTKAPLLIGEPGVGKTAVIEGLAQRIVEVRFKGFRFRVYSMYSRFPHTLDDVMPVCVSYAISCSASGQTS